MGGILDSITSQLDDKAMIQLGKQLGAKILGGIFRYDDLMWYL